MKHGILIHGKNDDQIMLHATTIGASVSISDTYSIPYDKTLIVESGTFIPWDLVGAAWHFLDRWDCAVPLYRYGVLASDIGTKEDRAAVRASIRDLRVLLYSYELFFVKNNDACKNLLSSWSRYAESCEKRLAFLRAFYEVKPIMCVLPTLWMARTPGVQPAIGRNSSRQRTGRPMVQVEIFGGQFVKCFAGDEEKVRALYDQRKARLK